MAESIFTELKKIKLNLEGNPFLEQNPLSTEIKDWNKYVISYVTFTPAVKNLRKIILSLFLSLFKNVWNQ